MQFNFLTLAFVLFKIHPVIKSLYALCSRAEVNKSILTDVPRAAAGRGFDAHVHTHTRAHTHSLCTINQIKVFLCDLWCERRARVTERCPQLSGSPSEKKLLI